ncbi:hypothetical protein NUACC26_081090 [Scytonema sp. NUACC26]
MRHMFQSSFSASYKRHPLVGGAVDLMTTYQQRFYERIGFQKNSTTTMILHNSDRLASLPTTEVLLQELHGG